MLPTPLPSQKTQPCRTHSRFQYCSWQGTWIYTWGLLKFVSQTEVFPPAVFSSYRTADSESKEILLKTQPFERTLPSDTNHSPAFHCTPNTATRRRAGTSNTRSSNSACTLHGVQLHVSPEATLNLQQKRKQVKQDDGGALEPVLYIHLGSKGDTCGLMS